MKIRIEAGVPRGTVTPPPSKSVAHRMLIGAALADGESVLHHIPDCEDVAATVDCLRALGVTVTPLSDGTGMRVRGNGGRFPSVASSLPCRESGSTLRFLLPVAARGGVRRTLLICGRLSSRPLSVYEALFASTGVTLERTDGSVTVTGELPAGDYEIPGNISSHFATGLLFALASASGISTLRILPPVESASYLELTWNALRAFGVSVTRTDSFCFRIDGNGGFHPVQDIAVEGDESAAAFFGAMNAVGGEVTLNGLSSDTAQGDRVWREYTRAIRDGCPALSLADCPDLAPVLMAQAALCSGALFTDTARLRYKESDRAAVMQTELARFGVRCDVGENTVRVYAPEALHPPVCDISSHNDHRIAMAMSLLAMKTGAVIDGAEAVSKSYPAYFEVLGSLGIRIKQL